jgi:hypothetical protein
MFARSCHSPSPVLAYSSDRGGEGNLDIWLQQVSGGTPLRLTDNPADDTDPSFSPDSKIIAYCADGIHFVPTLGGKRTLLARGGFRPPVLARRHPDGLLDRGANIPAGEDLHRGVGWGQSHAVPARFPLCGFPDLVARRALHCVCRQQGARSPGRNPTRTIGFWWVAPSSGGPAVRTSARKTFEG